MSVINKIHCNFEQRLEFAHKCLKATFERNIPTGIPMTDAVPKALLCTREMLSASSSDTNEL